MELAGKTILITRAASQSQPLHHALEQAGARVLECPAMEIAPVDDWSDVDRAISALASYDLLIFTSGNAVDLFMQRVLDAGISSEVPIAVIGAATAEKLARWNLTASLVPDTFRAEGLLELLPENMSGKRVLFPRAETAREILPEEMRRRGAVVDVVTVYRTVKSAEGLKDLRALLASERVDAIVLTSPSAVRFVVETLGSDLTTSLQGVAIAVIGPVVADTVAAVGLKVDIQSDKATITELVDKIRGYFSIRKAST
jgi:uroporphyrinogen III methyltransferase/synthase